MSLPYLCVLFGLPLSHVTKKEVRILLFINFLSALVSEITQKFSRV